MLRGRQARRRLQAQLLSSPPIPAEGVWVSYGDFAEHMLEALGPISQDDKSAIFRETVPEAYDVQL
jgi:hypothetical protein